MSRAQGPGGVRRRALMGSALAAGAAAGVAGEAAAATPPRFGRGIEGQRQAALGDGRYCNPIVPGDHPDPTILRDGADYYMTFSSFEAYPGVVIHHSRDLVHWAPIVAALPQPIGSVWACDLVKHQGRYYVYIPVMRPQGSAIVVIHADSIRGPWSAPVDLHIDGAIDPGHVVGEDGRRYLFVNGIRRIRLTDDGLATDGPLEHACEPWRYPADWVVEMFAPEGPKLFWRGGWLYMLSAVGGTAGPATSHMVTLARSRSVHGPWQHCPHNPIVRTRSADEPWWSRGHASVVQGPAGDWWMVYHGYENGFRTLGRQALLEPVAWTRDGWLRALGGTLNQPLPAPRGGQAGPAGSALSDPFTGRSLGAQWQFHAPGPDEMRRVRLDGDGLWLQGRGTAMADSTPLTCIIGDRRFEAMVELEISGDAVGGLGLFYEPRAHAGVGFSRAEMRTYAHGSEQTWMRQPIPAQRLRLRLRSHDQVLTFWTAQDGQAWVQHPWQMEVSGLHHNVFGGFLSLRLALFAAGNGAVRLRNFQYRGLA